jgi:hypothetical protein
MRGEIRKSGDREYIAQNNWVNSFGGSRHTRVVGIGEARIYGKEMSGSPLSLSGLPAAGLRSLYLHRTCTTVPITPLCGCLKRTFVLHTLDVIRTAQPPPPNAAELARRRIKKWPILARLPILGN